ALKQLPDDAELKGLLNDTMTDARGRLQRAHQAANEGGEPVRRAPSYNDASKREQEVARLTRSGRTDDAIRSAWMAADLFTKAIDEASRSSRTAASTPTPPPATRPSEPQPPTPTTPPSAPAAPPPATAAPPP